MIVKIKDESGKQSGSIVLNGENYEIFKSKAEKKLGIEITKFQSKEDDLEIDDDELFSELLKIKSSSSIFTLVAVQENRRDLLSEIDSLKNDLENMILPVSNAKKVSTQEKNTLKRKEEKIKLLENKIAEREAEVDNTETLKSYEQKEKMLLKKYNELKFKSIETKEARESKLDEIQLDIKKLEERRMKISQLFLNLKNAEKVDICFMCDCTGSMSSYINEAKTVVHRVVDKLGRRFLDLSLRCAFVGYRDHSDGADRVTVLPFTDNKDEFKNWVSSTVSASGGDDECEDVFGGLEEVNKLVWTNMTRVLFHIGDAPCHGQRFHSGAGDSHPSGDPRGLNIDNLLRGVAGKNIDYYFAEINSSTMKMLDEFDKVLAENQGRKIHRVKLATAESLLETVTVSITASIMSSKSLSMHDGHGKPLKTYIVDTGAIKWSDMSSFDKYMADFYEASFIGKLSNMKASSVDYDKRKVEIWLAKKPFAKGGLRYAFAAYVNMGTKEKPNLVKSVLKMSVFKDEHYNTADYYKKLIEVQVAAKYLAEEFMNAIKLIGKEKSIQFLDVNLAQIDQTGVYYTVEDYMDGEFTKWSNNAGEVNETDYSSALNAFSHWTYQATKEYLIVTDLQGFKTNSTYILTDPAITCLVDWDRFSSTNLGQKGLKKFFMTHQCNVICERLMLKKHEKYQILPNKPCDTVFE